MFQRKHCYCRNASTYEVQGDNDVKGLFVCSIYGEKDEREKKKKEKQTVINSHKKKLKHLYVIIKYV